MNLIQAISVTEREIVDARNTASTLRDGNKSCLPRNHYGGFFNVGFWSGNKQGLDFALEEIQKLKKLCSEKGE